MCLKWLSAKTYLLTSPLLPPPPLSLLSEVAKQIRARVCGPTDHPPARPPAPSSRARPIFLPLVCLSTCLSTSTYLALCFELDTTQISQQAERGKSTRTYLRIADRSPSRLSAATSAYEATRPRHLAILLYHDQHKHAHAKPRRRLSKGGEGYFEGQLSSGNLAATDKREKRICCRRCSPLLSSPHLRPSSPLIFRPGQVGWRGVAQRNLCAVSSAIQSAENIECALLFPFLPSHSRAEPVRSAVEDRTMMMTVTM